MSQTTADIFVARQPIFKRNKEVFAYELLFRSSLANYFDPSQTGEQATSKVITNSFLLIGIPRLAGGRKVFINFTEDLLLKGYPALFPRDIIVVEVLEDVLATPEVAAACQALAERGYVLALDDFIYNDTLLPLIKLAKIIKFDIRLLSLSELERQVQIVLQHNPMLKLLAEKVETEEEFSQCKKLGFNLFQGYFFSKPNIVSGRDITGSKLHYLQVLRLIQDENCDFSELTEIINRDASLAYKLLKYVNSPYYARPQEINSVHETVVMLGENKLRQWLALMMLSYIADDKPAELLRQAIIRGTYCEVLATELQDRSADSHHCHTAGMFSLLPAMLDREMAAILQDIALAPELQDALLGRSNNRIGQVLDLVIAYEQADWTRVEQSAGELEIRLALLPAIFDRTLNQLEAFEFMAG